MQTAKGRGGPVGRLHGSVAPWPRIRSWSDPATLANQERVSRVIHEEATETVSLNSDDGPKYMQAYRVLQTRLKSGLYPVGGRIPTESELSSYFDISRLTIRRALDLLVQDGYIESRQGSGYRVVTLSPASDTCLTSFTDAMLRAGREPRSRFLSINQFKAGAAALVHLPAELRDQDMTVIRRLRSVDGIPRMLAVTCAPVRALAGAEPGDFPESGPGQSILRILSDRFKLKWSAACEDISAISAGAELADMLNVAPASPLLQLTCSAFDDNGRIVFFEEVVRSGSLSFNLSSQNRVPRH